MTIADFNTYKETLRVARRTMTYKLHKQYKMFFSKRKTSVTEQDLGMLNACIYYINRHIMTKQADYDINIQSYCDLIKISELINKILDTDYRPTFLLDVNNQKSLRDGF